MKAVKQNTVKKSIRKSLKPCAEIGCGNLTRKTYCKTHEKIERKHTQIYNKYKRDPKTESFYKSREWRKLRALAYERDNGLCQRCKARGQLVRADVVHHIIEIKEDWSKRLDMDNLESLCHSCHNQIHNSTPRG